MDKQKAINKIEQLITQINSMYSSSDVAKDLDKAKELAIQIRAEIRKA